MAQILTTPTVQQLTAQQIGEPIMQSLQSLTNMQLENIQKEKQRGNVMAGLSTLMPPEQAKAMSYMPPEMLKTMVPQMQKQQQIQQGLEAYRAMQAKKQAEGVGANGFGLEDKDSKEAYERAYILSGGHVPTALKAEENARRRIEKSQQEVEKTAAEAPSEKNSLLNLKKYIADNKISKKEEIEEFLNSGPLTPVQKKILTTDKMTGEDDVVAYFLHLADGDPGEAMKLAKKFGMR